MSRGLFIDSDLGGRAMWGIWGNQGPGPIVARNYADRNGHIIRPKSWRLWLDRILENPRSGRNQAELVTMDSPFGLTVKASQDKDRRLT